MKNKCRYLWLLLPVPVIYYFWPEPALDENAVINKIVVLKSQRKMQVYQDELLLKTYTISLGGSPVGDKAYEGDRRTPEGKYIINAKNPNSVCYKNLGISYPAESDLAAAKKLGKAPGGDIKIHGMYNGRGWIGKFHRWFDWTAGCIAVTDAEMDEIYFHTATGTPIEIKP